MTRVTLHPERIGKLQPLSLLFPCFFFLFALLEPGHGETILSSAVKP
jgi:hypothetical protein